MDRWILGFLFFRGKKCGYYDSCANFTYETRVSTDGEGDAIIRTKIRDDSKMRSRDFGGHRRRIEGPILIGRVGAGFHAI